MSARLLDPTAIPLKERGEGNIWALLVGVTQLAIFFIGVICLLILFLPVIDTGINQKDQNAQLQRKINLERERNRELTSEIQEMKSDPAFVERVARDQLNFGKPYETVFRFDSYQATENSPAVPPSLPTSDHSQ